MPRDSSGKYSLVSGNPVQSGEVISSSWANNTMDDISVALTDSLDRSGRGGMLAPFRFADGTNLLPAAAWVNETSTGLYRFDGGDLRLAVLTQDVMRWQTTGVQIWNNTLSQWFTVQTSNDTANLLASDNTWTGLNTFTAGLRSTGAGIDGFRAGTDAGSDTQSDYGVAIGNSAGQTTQGTSAVSIGNQAGLTSQGASAVAVGQGAGSGTQGLNAVAVGRSAGGTSQGDYSIAVGIYSGQVSQGINSVAIGASAGNSLQGAGSTSVGVYAGQTSQGANSAAFGLNAGSTTQGSYAIAVGNGAGQTTQGDYGVSVGNLAGNNVQGHYSVAMGSSAGQTTQGAEAVAVGKSAGTTSQGNYSVAMGSAAGLTNQGTKGIIINASGATLNDTTAGHVHIASSLASMDFTSANGWSINGGNVGIGTDSPLVFGAGYTSLDIRGDTVGGAISLGDATSQYGYVLADDTGLRLQAYGARSVDFWTNDVQHMRIDSAGNVGIGTDVPSVRLQVHGSDFFSSFVSDTGLAATTWKANDTTGGGRFIGAQGNDCTFGWAGVAEHMRIDSAGNVGIGTTPPVWSTPSTALDIGTATSLADVSVDTHLSNNAYYNASNAWTYKTTYPAANYYQNAGTHVWRYAAQGTAGSPITWSEAMSIDTAGNLLVGTPTSLSNARLVVKGTTNAAGDVAALFVNGGGSTIFNANNDGRLYAPLIAPVAGTNVTWQADGQITKASSSLRYKENVSAVEENALNQINELTIKRFNFIGQEDFTCVGLIAEEVSETSLSGVVFKDEEGRPDALHDPSLLAVALKAIQELTARLEALEA